MVGYSTTEHTTIIRGPPPPAAGTPMKSTGPGRSPRHGRRMRPQDGPVAAGRPAPRGKWWHVTSHNPPPSPQPPAALCFCIDNGGKMWYNRGYSIIYPWTTQCNPPKPSRR